MANPRGYLDVRHNRGLPPRAVTTLTQEAGVRQFLDVGTGLPTQENVHQIAQRITPESRVVYVDNHPVVLAHARALLTSGPEGRTDYIDADLEEPARILEEAAKTLDFEQPIALVLVAILHFIEDEAAYPIVRELVEALPSGSRLVLSHLTEDLNAETSGRFSWMFTEQRGFTLCCGPGPRWSGSSRRTGSRWRSRVSCPCTAGGPTVRLRCPRRWIPRTSPASTTSRRSATATSTTSRTRTSMCTG